MFRRSVVACALALSVVLAGAGSVFAHECVISSRSNQGDAAAAAHSKVWTQLPLALVLGFIHMEVHGTPLTANQISWALAHRGSLPLSWTVRSDKTIGEGSSNPNLGNWNGLDHLVELVGPAVVQLYFAALAH